MSVSSAFFVATAIWLPCQDRLPPAGGRDVAPATEGGSLDAPKRGLRGFISNRGSGNMVDETLQAAFEIKTACDEISRKPAALALGAASPGPTAWMPCCKHLAAAPEGKPGLLRPNAGPVPARPAGSSWIPPCVCGCCWTRKTTPPSPLDLLGNTPHPSAARQACNAVRTARNEAAHAADRSRWHPGGHPVQRGHRERWKRAMRARRSRPVSWSSITGWRRIS